MTRKTIKVRIPAQTVEVDVADWALAYGVDESAVRADVIAYFTGFCAAAPDLLAALADVTVQLAQCRCHRKLTSDEEIALDAARAAIAKATAGAPPRIKLHGRIGGFQD